MIIPNLIGKLGALHVRTMTLVLLPSQKAVSKCTVLPLQKASVHVWLVVCTTFSSHPVHCPPQFALICTSKKRQDVFGMTNNPTDAKTHNGQIANFTSGTRCTGKAWTLTAQKKLSDLPGSVAKWADFHCKTAQRMGHDARNWCQSRHRMTLPARSFCCKVVKTFV